MNVYEILQTDDYKCAFCQSDDEINTHSLNFSSTSAKPIATVCEKCLELERSYRKKQEKELLDVLRSKRFSHWDISVITDGIKRMPMLSRPRTMAEMISWIIEDKSFMEGIARLYFEDLESRKNEQGDDLPF